MSTIFDRFCEEQDAMINPRDLTPKVDGFPEVCVTTFSEGIINDFIERTRRRSLLICIPQTDSFPYMRSDTRAKKWAYSFPG